MEDVKTLLTEHIENLNNDYQHYKDEYGKKDSVTVSEMIQDLDIDSMEFNAGYEQGYMHALQQVIRINKLDETYEKLTNNN